MVKEILHAVIQTVHYSVNLEAFAVKRSKSTQYRFLKNKQPPGLFFGRDSILSQLTLGEAVYTLDRSLVHHWAPEIEQNSKASIIFLCYFIPPKPEFHTLLNLFCFC